MIQKILYFFNKYVGLFVAVIALVVSIRESIHRRRHDRLSVRPWLQIIYNIKDDGDSGLILVNNGVGPGIITEIEVLYKNESIEVGPDINPWKTIRKKYGFPTGRYIYNYPTTPFWLPARESLKLFVYNRLKIETELENEKINRIESINLFLNQIKNIKVKIKYQSCYARKRSSKENYCTEFIGNKEI